MARGPRSTGAARGPSFTLPTAPPAGTSWIASCHDSHGPFSIRRFPVLILDLLSEWRRDSRRPRAKAARPRLALESLEERSLLSAGVVQTNLVADLPDVARVQD